MSLKTGYNNAGIAYKTKEGSALIARRDTGDTEALDSKYKFRDGLYQSFVSLTTLSLYTHFGLYFNLPSILYLQINITSYQNAWVGIPVMLKGASLVSTGASLVSTGILLKTKGIPNNELLKASLFSIGNLIGGFLLAPISDKIGRKSTCTLAAIMTAAIWAATYLLPEDFDLRLVYATRLIGGVAHSLSNSAMIYVSEATNKHWRHVFLSMISFSKSIGVPIAAVVGSILSWRLYAIFCLIVALFHALIFTILPESPHWLIHSDPERAEQVLMKLNKNQKYFTEEREALRARKLVREGSTFEEVRFLSREVRRPMVRLMVLKTIQHFSGVFVIGVYALQIFQVVTHSTPPALPSTPASINKTLTPTPTLFNTTRSPTQIFPNRTFNLDLTQNHQLYLQDVGISTSPSLPLTTSINATLTPTLSPFNATPPFTLNSATPNPNITEKRQARLDDLDTLCFIGVGVIRVVMCGLTVLLVKLINNRYVLISSAFGSAVFAVAFAAVSSGSFGPAGTALPLPLIILFYVFLGYGVLSIPVTLIGELIPLSYRAKGTGIVLSHANLLNFVTFTAFPFVLDWVGMSVMFFFFGIIAFVMCVYVYFSIPETQGKTFAEIEEHFRYQ